MGFVCQHMALVFCLFRPVTVYTSTRCDQQKTGLSAQRLNQCTERTAASGAE